MTVTKAITFTHHLNEKDTREQCFEAASVLAVELIRCWEVMATKSSIRTLSGRGKKIGKGIFKGL